jgi:hypothetical protein
MLHPLFITAEDGFDCIMDEALADYGTELRARINDMHLQAGSPTKDVRERLWDFKASQEKLGNTKAALLANAYIIFEQYLRQGDGQGVGGFSELKAGRIIAKTVFPRSKYARKNTSRNKHNQRYWYRHRARSIITRYRYFVATGSLLPETRGKCRGTSLIHDPIVRHYCFDVIRQLGQTWSARTFRDKVSKYYTQMVI